MSDYVTPKALASTLGKSIRTINRWKQQGYLPPYTHPGAWRQEAIKQHELLRFQDVSNPKILAI